jgi:hypothetical protein
MTFEGSSRNPFGETNNICSFLGTKETVYTEQFIRNDPRLSVLNPTKREGKISGLCGNVKKELIDKLMEMVEAYEFSFYGLRS